MSCDGDLVAAAAFVLLRDQERTPHTPRPRMSCKPKRPAHDATILMTQPDLARQPHKISFGGHLVDVAHNHRCCGRALKGGGGAAADSQHHGASRTEAVDKLRMSLVYLHII